MYVYSKNIGRNIWISKNKVYYQNWLKKVRFSHKITIEPTPSLPFRLDEMNQRLRTIDFKLNRSYLGNNFHKFDMSKRIWFICFQETQINAHYNILLHSPFYNKDINNDVSEKFEGEWYKLKSWNPYTQKYREVEDTPIHITPIRNNYIGVNYQTKKFNFDDLVESDNFFFSNPKFKRLEKKYVKNEYDYIYQSLEKLHICKT